jgi:hypothetical protein
MGFISRGRMVIIRVGRSAESVVRIAGLIPDFGDLSRVAVAWGQPAGALHNSFCRST